MQYKSSQASKLLKPATKRRQLKKMKPDLNYYAAVTGIDPKLENKLFINLQNVTFVLMQYQCIMDNI